jgi:hypothetical protein
VLGAAEARAYQKDEYRSEVGTQRRRRKKMALEAKRRGK